MSSLFFVLITVHLTCSCSKHPWASFSRPDLYVQLSLDPKGELLQNTFDFEPFGAWDSWVIENIRCKKKDLTSHWSRWAAFLPSPSFWYCLQQGSRWHWECCWGPGPAWWGRPPGWSGGRLGWSRTTSESSRPVMCPTSLRPFLANTLICWS